MNSERPAELRVREICIYNHLKFTTHVDDAVDDGTGGARARTTREICPPTANKSLALFIARLERDPLCLALIYWSAG